MIPKHVPPAYVDRLRHVHCSSVFRSVVLVRDSMWPFRRPFDDRCLKAAAGERSSSLRADICAPRRIVASISVFTAFRQASGTNLAKVENSKRRQEACRAPGFASHASPTLAALRLAHEHTRAQHARHARCTHASSTATCTCTHTATCAHTRTKASCGSSCHWPLADCRPARC